MQYCLNQQQIVSVGCDLRQSQVLKYNVLQCNAKQSNVQAVVIFVLYF